MSGIRLRELAEACGVDPSTVSRALRGDARVKPETGELIREKAREMGYRPNLAARALAAGVTRTVWMVLPGLDNPIEREPARYASMALLESGYDLMVVQHHNDPAIYSRILRRLTQGVADGAIVIPGPPAEPGLERDLIDRRYPLVFLDRHPAGLDAPTVTTENEEAAARLVGMLASYGARRFVVDFSERNPVAEARSRGSFAAAARLGLTAVHAEAVRSDPSPVREEAVTAFLHSTVGPVAGLIRGIGSVLPREKIFAGVFDNAGEAPFLAGRTVVCIQDFETMAGKAVGLILDCISSGSFPAGIHTVPAKDFMSLAASSSRPVVDYRPFV